MIHKYINFNYFKKYITKKDNIWNLQIIYKISILNIIYIHKLRNISRFIKNQRSLFWRINKEWHLFHGFKIWEIDNKRTYSFLEY